MRRLFQLCSALPIALLAVVAMPVPAAEAGDELDFDDVERHQIQSAHGVVAADEAHASKVGVAILEAGGNAADAGAATLLALGVTHPFGSGLGGGGFCLYQQADADEPTVLDFRETAPGGAHRDLYIVDGEADHQLAREGGMAVATPGEPAGIWALHGRFGQLDWPQVVDPALALARDGFPVGQTLARRIERGAEDIEKYPTLSTILRDDDGNWLEEGDQMIRADLANTLEVYRNEGIRPFYHGEIAEAVADTAQAHEGILTTDDLAAYRIHQRPPIHGEFGGYDIYSMPPPSSGGIALIQAFNILQHFEPADDADDDAWIHLVVEALKHAFADRARWLGDSDFVDVPVDKLISAEYAGQLAEHIDPDSVLDTEDYGTAAPHDDERGTTHLSVVDADDNMLACTTTINTSFGSLVAVPEWGLVLNNEMADFNIEPGEPNVFGLIGTGKNAVDANKRPLSSMSPTLVSEEGTPVMTIGASGGPMIISGVYFTILHTLLFDTDPLEATIAPRFHHQWIPESLRVETEGLDNVDALEQRGHDINVGRIFSAVQFIIRDDDTWIGVSDPRKGGVPAGADDDDPAP